MYDLDSNTYHVYLSTDFTCDVIFTSSFLKVVLNKYEMNIIDRISYCFNISWGFVQIVIHPT